MPSTPLKVAVLWHQHQPYYKLGNSYLLPWTRLHATKDYFDIIATLDRFPTIRQTVNVVPSLLIQLIDYVENGASDRALDLSRKHAAALDNEEKVELLRSFFLCNVERMVLPYPRYAELYQRGGRARDDYDGLKAAAMTFAEQDWRDLQVWYNLTWVGPYSRESEPFASLLKKGSSFTEEEKQSMLDASIGIIAAIIPLYRRLMERGQIELSVTPFYHPILPILCDSYSALEAMPNATLPENHIMVPEDAEVHIERAVALYKERFGVEPVGMWPSEGSVSDDALGLIRKAGLGWAASDEGVLRKTLGEDWNDLRTYFPYTLTTHHGPLRLVFRDRSLSDAIGFVYSNWGPKDAAVDFYDRLVQIRNHIIQSLGTSALQDALVSVILDGENCWEYYPENGRPFLEELYTLLSESNEIETTTVGAGIDASVPHPTRKLGRLYAGSWIGSNFKIWIGHAEDNLAWDALAAARAELMARREMLPQQTFAAAMEEIYIAEGSDWFWWFGDENSAANQDDFDDLFRAHLRNVYVLIGLEPPSMLDSPIRRAAQTPSLIPPTRWLTPTIDGRRFPDGEWLNAGHFIVEQVGGAMHRADAFERRVWFGRDATHLYLRFDTPAPLGEEDRVRLSIVAGRSISLHFSAASVALEAGVDASGRVSMEGMTAAIGEVIEAAIPLSYFTEDGDLQGIGISCDMYENGREVERFPHQGEVYCPLAAGSS